MRTRVNSSVDKLVTPKDPKPVFLMLLSAKWTGRQTFNLEIRVRSSVGVPNNAVTCHHEGGAANIPVNVAAGIFKELITLHARAGSLPVLPHQFIGT